MSRWSSRKLVLLAALLPTLVAPAIGEAAGPGFVQQASAHAHNVGSLNVTPAANVTTGNRIVVEVGVWSAGNAVAGSVTDTAGNSYVELLHFTASDGTEMSVWTAPITAGGGTRPTITVRPNATADVGAAASEYAGLSTVADATVADEIAHASGTTQSAATVASGATAPTAAPNELAVGMYVDSGFGDSLSAGSGWTQRTNISRAGDVELLTEDQLQNASGATPNASVATGASTIWLMATVVFKSATTGPPTTPGAPTNVTAAAGAESAAVSWTAPSNGGSQITAYTVTPSAGGTPQTPTTINGSPPTPSATITGLTDGTSYTFTVTATNAQGTGPPSAPSNPVTPGAQPGGQWGPLLSWPMVAIHSILLDNGKVLQFDGWQQPEPTQVYDPSTQTFTTQTAPDSIFCSGMAELPDGRVLVVGGYGGLSTGQQGIVDTTIFDPSTNTWSRVADMHDPRWYPDLTELGDGRYVAISGNSTNSTTWADTPELYDPSTNSWTLLSKVNTSAVHEEEYPFSYLVPNGDVFTIGPSEDKSFLLDVANQTWTQVGGSSGVTNGSSVMYRPGKILYTGGAASVTDSSSPAQSTAATIDLTAATPKWQPVAPMHYARIYHTLTMLADGTVLAVGGEPTAGQTGSSETTGGVLPSEIWNPNTGAWTVVASTGTTRGYHSTALLMPDGTVLVGGSGHANPGFPGQDSAQIYSPPYLFNGPRPTITSAPAATTYGATIQVSTPNAGSIGAVNLVSLGSDTHQSDMDQHFVPLSFTQGSGVLSVQIPSSAALAPPGHYMLFIVGSNGVPSVAPMISLQPTLAAPGPPTAVNAVAGNASANVSWTPPPNGGSTITSYTVTPYASGLAQPASTVTGSPAPTSAVVTGLTNGIAYTFTVTATNAIGSGPASTPSNAVTPSAVPTPAFVQAASIHVPGAASVSLTPNATIAVGDRLIVETGIWNSHNATASSVTDTAGNTYTELLHFTASDGTEMSVWSAPVTAGGGTRPTITVKPTSAADIGVAMVEYSGLSTAAGTAVLDQLSHASGTTSGAATVRSGATAASAAAGELALGFYADSGFGDSLGPGSGWTSRANVSGTSDMELLVEDQGLAAAGATPNAAVGTGASTIWLMATLVLKPQTIPGGAGDVAHRAPALARAASRPGASRARAREASRRRARTALVCRRHSRSRACRSLRQAKRTTAAARENFIKALLEQRTPTLLLCVHSKAQRERAARALQQFGLTWTGYLA